MNYGDYRDYNRDLANDRICAALDRQEEFPPDDEEDDDEELVPDLNISED